MGTLLVSLLAIVLALPVGLGVAIYLSEITSPLVRRFLRPALELLAGIPSVVYGFWGLTVLVPWIQDTWSLPVGETALAGGLILAIIAAELGEVPVGSPHYQALFILGAILFVITMSISLLSEYISRRSATIKS